MYCKWVGLGRTQPELGGMSYCIACLGRLPQNYCLRLAAGPEGTWGGEGRERGLELD